MLVISYAILPPRNECTDWFALHQLPYFHEIVKLMRSNIDKELTPINNEHRLNVHVILNNW